MGDELGTTNLSTTVERDPATLLAAFAALPRTHSSRPAMRRRVIEAWLPLAYRLARHYRDRGEPLDDLCQVAAVGLIKAIDRYDPRAGRDFIAFATPTINGEIKRHFRDFTWPVHVPRAVKEHVTKVRRAAETVRHHVRREPTTVELSEELRISAADVLDAVGAARAYRPTPLVGTGDVEDDVALGTEERGYEFVECWTTVTAALATRGSQCRAVVWLRLFCDLPQQQIADRIGVSQVYVSRVLAAAGPELRRALTAM